MKEEFHTLHNKFLINKNNCVFEGHNKNAKSYITTEFDNNNIYVHPTFIYNIATITTSRM